MPDARILVLATRNKGKIRELREPLALFGFDVQGLPDNFPDTEENGRTFEENALLKARAAAQTLGFPALADDSGLEVDALGGDPGVYSARYSLDWPAVEGESLDERNNRKLLARMEGVPECQRGARFRCCMAMVWPAGQGTSGDITVGGSWEGRIAQRPSGSNGFGYDAVFIDPELGLTGGEMGREEKMSRSHRAKALALLLAELKKRNVA